MIKVQIISSENLPISTKNERKTKILCFSSSSCNYFYDSYKSTDNNQNPKWNSSFDVDLYRCNTLFFKLYSSRLLSPDIFLGEVNIDFISFLLQSPGSEILQLPHKIIQYKFPVTSCTSPNAHLTLSFLYVPKIYRPIQIKDYSNFFIHVWLTYNPPISNFDNQIEIELLQACSQNDFKAGYFFNLKSFHSFESVGYGTSKGIFRGQTGFTPIITFSMERINEKVNFLIVNVGNYKGVVTVNFVGEQKEKEEYLDEKFYLSVKKNNVIGTIKSVDILVEPNKKYCAPVCFYYQKKLIKSDFVIKKFQNFTTHNFQKSDVADQLFSEIPFNSSIIEVAQSEIEILKNVKLMKTFVLPMKEQISLQKVFHEFNLHPHFKIRIYINGSTTSTTGSCAYTNFWKPHFKIYDKEYGHLCHEISKPLLKPPLFHFRTQSDKSSIPIDWHSYVDLDLDEIGPEKIIVFIIRCRSSFKSANSNGMIGIASSEMGKEILLFRNQIFEDDNLNNFGIFMRFEYINREWFIIPMKYCFTQKKKLDYVADALFKNNWMITDCMIKEIEENLVSGSSDDEILLDEIESVKT